MFDSPKVSQASETKLCLGKSKSPDKNLDDVSSSSSSFRPHPVNLEPSISVDASVTPPPPSPLPTFLCCSGEQPEDFQVDLCPRSWFFVDDGRGVSTECCWKVLVLTCCLPFCYPCYLTRQCRRKKKNILEISGGLEGKSPQSPTTMQVTRAHRKVRKSSQELPPRSDLSQF